MSDHAPSSAEPLRVFFRGTSKLDEAIRNARPMARLFLLWRLVEDGWRLQEQGAPVTVDPVDLAKGGSEGNPVSVRFPLDWDSPVTQHLRSMPAGGRTAQLFRIETLKALAAAGLAAQSRQVRPAVTEGSHQSPTANLTQVIAPAGPAADIRQEDAGEYSHLPFGRLAEEVTLA